MTMKLKVRDLLPMIPVGEVMRIVDHELREVFNNSMDVVGKSITSKDDYDIMQHIDHSLLDRVVKNIYSNEHGTISFLLEFPDQ